MSDPAAVLQTWHDAVNAGDIEAAVACCDENVAVQGPRGVGHGHDLVRGWLARSGIRLEHFWIDWLDEYLQAHEGFEARSARTSTTEGD